MELKRTLYVTSAVFFPMFIGAAFPEAAHYVRTFTTAVVQPFLEIQHTLTTALKREAKRLADIPRLQADNQALNEELAEIKQSLVAMEELRSENKRLTELLAFKKASEFKTVTAQVIGRDPSQWNFFIMINRGLRDDVRDDAALLNQDGLVGRVVSAGPHASRAILIADLQSRVSAMNQRTREAGLVEGTGTTHLKMAYLDRDADAQIGDLIISSGLGGIYPKGIPIGRIQLIGEENNRLTRYAIIKPFVSYDKLEEVLCVLPLTDDSPPSRSF